MTRYIYGGGGDGQSVTTSGTVRPSANATVYNARTGGSVVTDIQNMSGVGLSGIVTTDSFGQAIFLGPDAYTAVLWLDFGTGPRWALGPKDNAAVSAQIQTAQRTTDNTSPSLTTKAGIPYKSSVPLWQNAAGVLDPMVEPRFATATARNTAFPSPADGDHCYRTDLHAKQYYSSGAARWVTMDALIAETILGSTAATISFSSIPQEWRNLRLYINCAGTDSAIHGTYLQFNGDTGNNYGYHATAASAGASSFSHSFAFSQILISNTTSSSYGTATNSGTVVDILNYTDATRYKYVTFNSFWGNYNGSEGGQGNVVGGGIWENLSTAITSLTLNPGVGTFRANTAVRLYGVS